MVEWSHYQLAWLLNYIVVWWYTTTGFKGLVWYMCLNTCFQFLKNITGIFTHFLHPHVFPKNTNNVTKRPLSHWFSKFIHTWKLVLRGNILQKLCKNVCRVDTSQSFHDSNSPSFVITIELSKTLQKMWF